MELVALADTSEFIPRLCMIIIKQSSGVTCGNCIRTNKWPRTSFVTDEGAGPTSCARLQYKPMGKIFSSITSRTSAVASYSSPDLGQNHMDFMVNCLSKYGYLFLCDTFSLCKKDAVWVTRFNHYNWDKTSLENNIGRVSSNPREQKSREASPIIHILTGKQR